MTAQTVTVCLAEDTRTFELKPRVTASARLRDLFSVPPAVAVQVHVSLLSDEDGTPTTIELARPGTRLTMVQRRERRSAPSAAPPHQPAVVDHVAADFFRANNIVPDTLLSMATPLRPRRTSRPFLFGSVDDVATASRAAAAGDWSFTLDSLDKRRSVSLGDLRSVGSQDSLSLPSPLAPPARTRTRTPSPANPSRLRTVRLPPRPPPARILVFKSGRLVSLSGPPRGLTLRLAAVASQTYLASTHPPPLDANSSLSSLSSLATFLQSTSLSAPSTSATAANTAVNASHDQPHHPAAASALSTSSVSGVGGATGAFSPDTSMSEPVSSFLRPRKVVLLPASHPDNDDINDTNPSVTTSAATTTITAAAVSAVGSSTTSTTTATATANIVSANTATIAVTRMVASASAAARALGVRDTAAGPASSSSPAPAS